MKLKSGLLTCLILLHQMSLLSTGQYLYWILEDFEADWLSSWPDLWNWRNDALLLLLSSQEQYLFLWWFPILLDLWWLWFALHACGEYRRLESWLNHFPRHCLFVNDCTQHKSWWNQLKLSQEVTRILQRTDSHRILFRLIHHIRRIIQNLLGSWQLHECLGIWWSCAIRGPHRGENCQRPIC